MTTVRITHVADHTRGWRAHVRVTGWFRSDEDYEAYALPASMTRDDYTWYRYDRSDRDERVAPAVQRKLEAARGKAEVGR